MNRIVGLFVLGALTACSSAGVGNQQAQAAGGSGGTESRISVLGVNIGDSPAVVRDKLTKEGFKKIRSQLIA
ncbi:hypothetical protein MOP88_14470 [Sphingomonas sp. WKB10]|nr:hypothetical protein [Sphingomonas sp. WKB10]